MIEGISMGIYLPNMEIPKTGCYILSVDNTGNDKTIFTIAEQTHSGKIIPRYVCEAVPVPPHGRLIDVRDILKNQHDVILKNGAKHRCFDTTLLSEIPTIIEAEEGET